MRILSPEEISLAKERLSEFENNVALNGVNVPFLYLKRNPNIVLSSRLIGTKKPPLYACFAIVQKSSLRPNGIFFSLLEEELAKEGLAIHYFNFPAVVSYTWHTGEATLDEDGFPLAFPGEKKGLTHWETKISLNNLVFSQFLEKETTYISSKAQLMQL
jgi:hypothetical protein